MSGQNDLFFILLRDRIGKKKEKGVLRTTFTKVDVLSGTLLSFLVERDERGNLTWVLETLEPENIEIECSPQDTGQLTQLQFLLLLPIPVCRERLSVFRDSRWLHEGVELRVGDSVIVTLKGQPDLQGWIKHKGELPGVKGIHFGVELIPEHNGKGTSDGIFRKKRFFSCGINCAVFVALHKLRKDNDPASLSYHEKYGNQEFSGAHAMDMESELIQNCGLKEKDRIVWLSDAGPEFGEVKWVGILPDSRRSDVTVGVEFDNPVGSGTGKYKNHRLFHAKPQHASLVPIMGLMKAEEYLSAMPQPSAPCAPVPPTYSKNSEIEAEYHFRRENVPELPEKLKLGLQEDPKLVKQEQQNIILTTADIHTVKPSNIVTKQVVDKLPVQSTTNKGVNPLYEYTKNQDQIVGNVETESYEQPYSGKSHSSRPIPPPDPDLEVGSMVEVMANPPLYGLIRWIGYLPDQKEPVKPIAGLEMDEEISAGTDGSFRKHRIFSCPPKRAFFVPLYKCRKDKRFVENSSKSGAFGNNFGSMETPDVNGNISPPDSFEIETIQEKVCGKQRGIQGHHNSCYLDATLFAMFYFTTVFDGILYRPKRSDDLKEYEEVKQVIKEGIVNPLRRYHYVRADKVMKLRHLLDKVGNIPGMMSEEKDPEEFLNLVLNQITKADPFLHIKQDDGKDVQHSFLYQLIMEKDERLVLPTTQQLFELSFLQMKVKLKERPSCLILQMPRFGKDYKMYRRIVPSMELDITDVLENAPRECIICGDLAGFECKECYNQHGAGLNTIAFCKDCNDRSHRHKNRVNHNWQVIQIPPEYKEIHQQQKAVHGQNPSIPREKMELFAVVCIQTSHYVSFVKCGKNKDAPWVFFDSMADRMGEQSGYNIPEVKLCANLSQWLSEDSQPEIMKRSDDKELPPDIRRLLCDAYMCMYHSPEVAMFK